MATRELVPARDAGEMWTARQVEIIKAQIAPGVDDANLEYFAAVCRRTGLDPFTKQIYFIGRGKDDGRTAKKWSVQTGIDGYRLIAARTGELAGIDDAEYDTEDAKQPAWARVTVWRFVQGQRVPFTAKARMAEYKPTYGGDMWARMPYLMLAKCAEALALRKAFPAELSGVYTGEEMMQAADPLADTPRPAPVAPARRQPQPAPRVVEAAPGGEHDDEPAITFSVASDDEPDTLNVPRTIPEFFEAWKQAGLPPAEFGPLARKAGPNIAQLEELAWPRIRAAMAPTPHVEHDLRDLPMAAHGSH